MNAFIIAALLLIAALVLYLPMLLAPGAWGGDMVGLAFILISTWTTGALLLGSALAVWVQWLRLRARKRGSA